jgi:DNA-binding GntR family transcriptional regulator
MILDTPIKKQSLQKMAYQSLRSESEKAVTRANREHTLILDALRNGDRAKAKKVLRKHLRNGLWVIESHLETVV